MTTRTLFVSAHVQIIFLGRKKRKELPRTNADENTDQVACVSLGPHHLRLRTILSIRICAE